MHALYSLAPETDMNVPPIANGNIPARDARGTRREGPNLNRLPGVIFQFRLFPDGRTCFPFASPQIADLCGVTPDEIREDAYPVFNRIDPDDLELLRDTILDSAVTMKNWVVKFRAQLDDGRQVRLRAESSPETLWDGSVLWHGYLADIGGDSEAAADPRLSDSDIHNSILNRTAATDDVLSANQLDFELAMADAEALNYVFRD